MTTTYGDVEASVTACTCLDRDGQPCGKPGAPRLPIGVCLDHAVAITRAVLKLGGGLTALAKEATR